MLFVTDNIVVVSYIFSKLSAIYKNILLVLDRFINGTLNNNR